jgi:hypothetical protein
MKRYILLLATSFVVICAMGNIAPPKAFISEVFFDGSGNWTIELGFYPYYYSEIDSIRIESSTGSSIINFCTLTPGGGSPNFDSITVITKLNLVAPVSINPNADYIKVTSYIFGYGTYDYVAFGNYPGSFLDCKQNSESIAYVSYSLGPAYTSSFCIDRSPTPGYGNDTTGAMCNFSGKVYDLSGNAFTNGMFSLPPLMNTTIEIQPDGSFFERVFARRYMFDTLTLYFPPWPYAAQTYTVEHVDFCVRPDGQHTQDIITTSLVTAIDKHKPDNENIVVVSPNPFTEKVSFYFNMGKQYPGDEITLSIYGPDGRLLKQVKLTVDQNSYEWIPDESVPAGVLVFTLMKNGQTVKSGKLLKL